MKDAGCRGQKGEARRAKSEKEDGSEFGGQAGKARPARAMSGGLFVAGGRVYWRCDLSQLLKILVAITGASGALYAQRLLDNLDPQQHEIHVVLSNYAHQVIAEELPGGLRLPEGVKPYGLKSMNVPFASGSNPPDAMVVIPCTMGTLGRIAHGYSEDVLLRAADVALKERKKLILVPRETPVSLIHVKNFELLLLAGATLIPANPSFYMGPKTIVEVVDTVVARVLDHLGVKQTLVQRWSEEAE